MRSTSSIRRSWAVRLGDSNPPLVRLRGRIRFFGGPIAAHRAQRRVSVVVLVHAGALVALEVEDLDHAVGDLQAAVLPAALAPCHDHDRGAGVHHLLDHEVELADRGTPLRPVATHTLMAVVGARVRVVRRRDPLDVLAHVVEHPATVARVPGLITLLHKLYEFSGHAPKISIPPFAVTWLPASRRKGRS